jgi:hypothetical protein
MKVLRFLTITLVLFSLPGFAAKHGFGLSASSFSPDDEPTELIFGIDSDPIGEVFYRFQTGAHNVIVGVGSASWENITATSSATLDFVPIGASYRYLFWHDKPVALVVGGGLGIVAYTAELSGSGSILFTSETGALTAIEPVVGVEFLANRLARLHLTAKYSWQIASADDIVDPTLITPLDVDMTGIYVTAGISFMFGD